MWPCGHMRRGHTLGRGGTWGTWRLGEPDMGTARGPRCAVEPGAGSGSWESPGLPFFLKITRASFSVGLYGLIRTIYILIRTIYFDKNYMPSTSS